MPRVPDFSAGTYLQSYILDEYWETNLDRLACTPTWADNTEIMALAVLFSIWIHVHVYSSLGGHFDKIVEPLDSCPFT